MGEKPVIEQMIELFDEYSGYPSVARPVSITWEE
jgi:hypothetical protein